MSDFTYIPDFPIETEKIYDVIVSAFENSVEQRRAKSATARRKFTLTFGVRSKTVIDAIEAFFDSKSGPLIAFTWTNPETSVEHTVRFVENSLRRKWIAPNVHSCAFDIITVL